MQEILPTVALAFWALPPATLLPQSPKTASSPLEEWRAYAAEAGAEPLMATTLVNVPLASRPQHLDTIVEAQADTAQDDESNEKQFRGWTVGGALWSIRQASRAAQQLLTESATMSAACMTSLMLCLCVGFLYM